MGRGCLVRADQAEMRKRSLYSSSKANIAQYRQQQQSASRGHAGTYTKGVDLIQAKLDKFELVSFSKKESDDSKHNKFRM